METEKKNVLNGKKTVRTHSKKAEKNVKKVKVEKIFILDTSVLIVDFAAFLKFDEHDVVLPVDVLSELDKFKKTNDDHAFSAREVGRLLEEYSSSPDLYGDGVSMGMGKGKLSVYLLRELNPIVKKAIKDDTVDHRIISVALNIKQKKSQTKEVVVVSNDRGLLFKAGALGLSVEKYKNDRVDSTNGFYTGLLEVDNYEGKDSINTFYKNKKIPASNLKDSDRLYSNQFVLLKEGEKSVLSIFKDEELHLISKRPVYGRTEPRNAEQTLALNVLFDKNISVVSIVGPAGTGKTLLAIGAGLSQVNDYEEVYISRPIVPLSNKDIGFLPGDVQSKIAPYMQPLYDNIKVLKRANGSLDKKKNKQIDELFDTDKVCVEPLAYIRGRSISGVFFVIDEAQNLTQHEIKTIITRAGEGTKLVFTGDIDQIDHPYLDSRSNGLTYLIEAMKHFPNAAHITLVKGERSYLAEWAAKNM